MESGGLLAVGRSFFFSVDVVHGKVFGGLGCERIFGRVGVGF